MELAGVSLPVWGGFATLILAMLALDLGVFHRKPHEVEMKEALIWSAVWVGLALAFNGAIFLFWDQFQSGSPLSNREAGLAFFAGYLVEKALSIDNIFVFLVIFAAFKVPRELRHRVLFWGIVGALLLRGLFIAIGSAALEHFAWTMILFGLLLIATAVRMVVSHGKEVDPKKNPLVRWVSRVLPVTEDYEGGKFTVRRDGRLWVTPLLLVLIVVEFTDLVFAIDSIPAIFAITDNPFLVFTSNVFAILGLRALFFAVSGLVEAFRYLSYGLAAVLAFVGLKMLYAYFEKEVVPIWPKFPVEASLGVIAAILAIAMGASVIANRQSSRSLRT